jgi:SAM-dependent methyltransferase
MAKDSHEDFDKAYFRYRKKHPNVSYAQFHMERVGKRIKDGGQHPSLGKNLSYLDSGPIDFWQAGARKAGLYFEFFEPKRSSRVLDYGCGSLRIGAHFIRFLDPGCFMGMDVTSAFYEVGETLVGEELMKEKKPTLAVIGDEGMKTAEAFGADFVYSNSVSFHVHPDETTYYYGNLAKIAHRKGAVLAFNAGITDEMYRYRQRSWAWPLEFYKQALSELEFVRSVVVGADRDEGDKRITFATLEFRRA